MTTYRFGTRYSRWDGTQQLTSLDADQVMGAIADELMRDGDLLNALRRLFWEGMEGQDGERMPGLRDLVNRVRQQRQQQLNQYDMGSVLDDIRERLRDVIDTERDAIGERVERGRETLAASEAEGAAGEGSDPHDPDLQKLLEQMANRHLAQLDDLPGDPAGAIRALQEYDFMDPGARAKFGELVQMIQQQVVNQTFQGMEQALDEMTPEQVAEMRQMMSELNEMLERNARGEDPGFEQFMHRWGHFFGPDIRTLDDLLEHMRKQTAAMQQLMDSMSPDQREQLQGMMQAVMQDPGLQQEMQRLQQNLGQAMRDDDWRRSYSFQGDESMTLGEAMRMLDRVSDLDDLERELRDVRDWRDFADLDDERIRDLVGDETAEQMRQLGDIARILEEAGYVREGKNGFQLTPQGVRKIGEQALNDIFLQLKRDRNGQHELNRTGNAGERTDLSKPYEFGDPFLLDLEKTVMNAVQRGGAGSPVKLEPADFEVYRTEHMTRSSTVLMIDMSRSMFYSDSFTAAKRIALALDSLIRSKYPRDTLHIIGFSYVAEELQATDLPTLTWNEYQYGTNMQHGFQLARQLLSREKGSNRQIIMITDGEPTAHIEEGEVFFNWPPVPRTFQETLREVVRCTRDGITINTFMLERTPALAKFVDDLMRINGGRVFASDPGHLGEYILVDYVAQKRKWVG